VRDLLGYWQILFWMMIARLAADPIEIPDRGTRLILGVVLFIGLFLGILSVFLPR
jgi:threonine/homoserine efflux transporter RhtA